MARSSGALSRPEASVDCPTSYKDLRRGRNGGRKGSAKFAVTVTASEADDLDSMCYRVGKAPEGLPAGEVIRINLPSLGPSLCGRAQDFLRLGS
jgi:hypothetical protein